MREATLWLRCRLAPGAVVLGYHRVAEPATASGELCVSPANFAQQLEVVRTAANPLPLGDLVERTAVGTLPERALAITFDDGYADLPHTVLPLLRKAEVPATVFVVSAMLGGEFWWDRLTEAVRTGSESRPQETGVHHQWPTQSEVSALPAAERDRLRLPLGEPAYTDTVPSLLSRCVTAAELCTLAAEPLVSIGSHTRTHPWLPLLSPHEQRREIRGSKEELESIVGSPLVGFSYPHGGVSPVVREEVRAAGYAFACGSNNGVVTGTSDRFAVPRFWVGDLDGDAFDRWLRRWLHG